MSEVCMYVLRGVADLDVLRSKLTDAAKAKEYGLCFDPINNLLLEHKIDLNEHDFVFEACDSFANSAASLLLCHDGIVINGVQASRSLRQRLEILQEIAIACISHAKTIEIYLGEDSPYLPDYSNYRLTCVEIADTLYKEYQLDETLTYIPCVHLVIEE